MAIADREVGFKWRYYSPTLVVDGGRNKFTARIKSTGGEAWLQIFKRMPGGVRVLVREIQSELGKSDHAAIVQSGADLHWTLTAHEGDTACNEQEGVLTGVCVPYPGNPQLGMAGAWVPDGGTTVDPEQLKAALREVLGIPAGHNYDLAAALATVVGNMKPKARAALDEAFDGGNGSPIVYQQLRNTSYSGALDALHHGDADTPEEPTE